MCGSVGLENVPSLFREHSWCFHVFDKQKSVGSGAATWQLGEDPYIAPWISNDGISATESTFKTNFKAPNLGVRGRSEATCQDH